MSSMSDEQRLGSSAACRACGHAGNCGDDMNCLCKVCNGQNPDPREAVGAIVPVVTTFQGVDTALLYAVRDFMQRLPKGDFAATITRRGVEVHMEVVYADDPENPMWVHVGHG